MNRRPETIYVIGCGGVGTYLVPALIHSLTDESQVVLVDGDTFSEDNLKRQHFSERYVGWNKAEALADMYGLDALNQYLTERSEIYYHSLLLVGVDNHKARRVALEKADSTKSVVIIGANEYRSSMAIYYEPSMKGTPLDPRIADPTILTDLTGDPTSPHCMDELTAHPQLAIFNSLTASFMLHLFHLHYNERITDISVVTHKHQANFNKMRSVSHEEGRAAGVCP